MRRGRAVSGARARGRLKLPRGVFGASSAERRVSPMINREAECAALDEIIEAVRKGESRALVVHGDPGVGKTALLEYLAGRASDCRLLSAAGVESEMELAFAALHQLCTPVLDRLELLPTPQRDALGTT